MADLSSSADSFPSADTVKTYILLTVISPSATVPSLNTVWFFSDPFLTQNGLTPPWVAMSPHIHNQQQFEVSLCLFYWFLSKMHSCTCLTPLLHLSCRICIICCSDSTWTIGCRTNPFCSCEATTASQMATCPSPQNAPKVLYVLKIWQS